MNIYLLICNDRHADLDVTPYADKDEAIQTAAARAERDVNRFREDKPNIPVSEIVEVGTGEAGQHEWGGLNPFMVEDGWVFYINSYDDGPTYYVYERELVR